MIAGLLVVGCASRHGGGPDGGDRGAPDACVGLQCQVAACQTKNLPDTTLTGTVYAPNGTLPLYGITVYVPNTDPGPFSDGVQCSRCSDALPGQPIVQTTTIEDGSFTLAGVPAGDNIPLVITSGKWRRQITIPHVAACDSTPIAAADTTLPKSRTDLTPNTKGVDLPLIALSTGNADALECLIRKLGIDDKEITTDAQGGRVHLFADTLAGNGEGTDQFKVGFAGGSGSFSDSQTLWGSLDKMKHYDLMVLSCEGNQYADTKPQAAMDAVKAYADLGGRIFLSHWHNVWLEGASHPAKAQKPQQWTSIATWNDINTDFSEDDTIDEVANPKGAAFATWMMDPHVAGSTARDQVAVVHGKETCTGVDPTKAERWVYHTSGATQTPQNFQFTTPIEVPAEQRCGKVVFSDMHVSSDSGSAPGGGTKAYPNLCAASALTPQEKALAFMLFDISSCVGTIQ